MVNGVGLMIVSRMTAPVVAGVGRRLASALASAWLGGLLLGVVAPAQANLLINGNFEDPVLLSSDRCGPFEYCKGYNSNVGPIPPSDIPGWSTIGPGGSLGPGDVFQWGVLLLGSQYVEKVGDTDTPLHFTAQDGQNSVDLSGSGNQGANGIKQTVETVFGMSYALSFFIGNQTDQAPGYILASSVELYIDGILIDTLVNAVNNPEPDLSWVGFTFNFVASSTETTIAFLNATGLGDNEAGLDNVRLEQVPEPSTLALLAGGVAFGWYRRRRRAA